MNSTKTDSSPRTEKCRDSSTLPEAPFPPRDGDFTITPEWAARVLAERNTRNRNLRTSYASLLAEDVRARKWVFNGVPIIFASDGALIDGQHRLAACVKAGVPFPSSVRVNIADSNLQAFSTIDIGRKRFASDVLKNVSASSPIAAASAIAVYFSMVSGRSLENQLHSPSRDTVHTKTNENIKNFYFEHPGLVDRVSEFSTKAGTGKTGLRASFVGGVTLWLALEKEYSEKIVFLFFDELRYVCKQASTPAVLLREQIARWNAEKKSCAATKTSGDRKTKLFLRAFVHWLFAREPKTISNGRWQEVKVPAWSELTPEVRARLKLALSRKETFQNDLR